MRRFDGAVMLRGLSVDSWGRRLQLLLPSVDLLTSLCLTVGLDAHVPVDLEEPIALCFSVVDSPIQTFPFLVI